MSSANTFCTRSGKDCRNNSTMLKNLNIATPCSSNSSASTEAYSNKSDKLKTPFWTGAGEQLLSNVYGSLNEFSGASELIEPLVLEKRNGCPTLSTGQCQHASISHTNHNTAIQEKSNAAG